MNARDTDSYVGIPTSDRKAFCCNLEIEELEEQGHLGALAWVRRFANETNETNRPLPEVLARTGMQWYELTTDEEAEIFTMMNPDDRMFYAKFNQPTFINQRLIGLKRRRVTDDLNLLHALLNSILSLFYIEAVGFGRGLGVLDINKDSISKGYMLNPALLSNALVDKIKNKFALLINRGIVGIEQDLADSARREFDMEVLNAYGIGNYYETIINSFMSMRRMRKTVRQSSNIQVHIHKEKKYEPKDDMYYGRAAE